MANEKTYDPLIGHAIEVVDKTYGEAVSVHKKGKSLIKFGRNDDIGLTEEMVWLQGGIETLPTGNTIDSVKSTNAGDTQVVQIEGHTIDGSGNLTFVVQSATLNGTTRVVLTTPLARTTRIYNDSATNFAGTVSVYVNGGALHVPFRPFLIVPPSSDVRVMATSSGTTTGVEATIHGYLATKV